MICAFSRDHQQHFPGGTMTELHDAITKLTQDHNVDVTEHGRHLGTRRQTALLHKLDQARASNIGTGSGDQTAAHQRSTLNLAASDLYASVQRQVKRWAIAIDVPRHWALRADPTDWRNPAQLLLAWHTRAIGIAGLDLDPYTRQLETWIHAIEDLVVDPPRRWTIAAPCPLCTQRWALDADGMQIDALGVTERDPVTDSIVTCRNCTAVWRGIEGPDGARKLAIAIDDASNAA